MTKKILYIFIAINLATLLAASLYFLFSYKKVFVTPLPAKIDPQEIQPSVTPTPDPDAPFSTLLLGYAGGKHDGAYLTDSIILARVQPKTQQVFLITIPRDMWVYLPLDTDKEIPYKINSAYAWGNSTTQYPNRPIQYTGEAGGGQLAKDTLQKVLGIPIQNFISLDFQAFQKTIDTLGGIDVKVQRTFDDPLYPLEDPELDTSCGKSEEEISALTATMSGSKLEELFPCRYETLHFDKGLQHMDGVTALKFARSRHSPVDGGDYNRSARQKLVIEATKDKILTINFIPKIIPFINTLSYHLQTDLTLSDIEKHLQRVSEYKDYEIVSYALSEDNLLKQSRSTNGQFILAPKAGETDYSEIHTTLEALFNNTTLEVQ